MSQNSMFDLDREEALDRVGGDLELLQEVAALFLEEYPVLLDHIRQAIGAGDALALEHSAHSLKGSVGNFGAKSAHEAAFQLELAGRTHDLSRAPERLAKLESSLSHLHVSLLSLCEGQE
ncbi:MAG: Hpt domain-containing protein [Acidobacteria bacterium]|nr:Hpt domain-containing protein [Acidobacteriota bacterium]